MIYQKTNGEFVHTIGWAYKLGDIHSIDKLEVIGFATNEESDGRAETTTIPIFYVLDQTAQSYYFAYKSEKINGLQMLYKDKKENLFMCSQDYFYGNVNKSDGDKSESTKERRFRLLTDKELFQLITGKKKDFS